jgi:two-component system OmpR family response regulator
MAGSPSVLIADDDPTARDLVQVALGGADWTLFHAADGDAAWALLHEQRPAVVVLDLTLPGRYGLNLIRAIRAEPALRRTYVIVLTGRVHAGTAEGALAAGADRYLTKPFSPQALLRAVSQGFELA